MTECSSSSDPALNSRSNFDNRKNVSSTALVMRRTLSISTLCNGGCISRNWMRILRINSPQYAGERPREIPGGPIVFLHRVDQRKEHPIDALADAKRTVHLHHRRDSATFAHSGRADLRLSMRRKIPEHPGRSQFNQRPAQAASPSARHGRTREGAARGSRSQFPRIAIMDHSRGGHRPPNARIRRESGSETIPLTSEMVTSPSPTSPTQRQNGDRSLIFGS